MESSGIEAPADRGRAHPVGSMACGQL